MERLRTLTLVAGLTLPVTLGCHTSQRVSERMSEKVTHVVQTAANWDAPTPATQVVCFWQRRLTQLPDPTREGAQAPGLVGQVFLVTADSNTAEVAGDVTVSVYDETPRPSGQPTKSHEVWHFDKATLKKLIAGDERFGKSHVLFLPWPAGWQDVTTVRILARYDVPGMPTIYAEQLKMTLDMNDGPVWKDANGNPMSPNPGRNGAGHMVPDGRKLAEQVRAGSGPPPGVPTSPVIQPTTAVGPVPTITAPANPPASLPPTVLVPPTPVPPAPTERPALVAPIIVPRMGS